MATQSRTGSRLPAARPPTTRRNDPPSGRSIRPASHRGPEDQPQPPPDPMQSDQARGPDVSAGTVRRRSRGSPAHKNKRVAPMVVAQNRGRCTVDRQGLAAEICHGSGIGGNKAGQQVVEPVRDVLETGKWPELVDDVELRPALERGNELEQLDAARLITAVRSLTSPRRPAPGAAAGPPRAIAACRASGARARAGTAWSRAFRPPSS